MRIDIRDSKYSIIYNEKTGATWADLLMEQARGFEKPQCRGRYGT